MTGINDFRYDGKRALVVGGASGIGAATARLAMDLGAEVLVMDYAPVEYRAAKAIRVDLQDRASLDAAIDQLGGPIDALFSAAGIADGEPLMRVNFIGHRHLIERLSSDGSLRPGATVCLVSSVAGIGWESALPTLIEFLATPDYETADAWVKSRPETNNYGFAKQAVNAYVARQALRLMQRGIRINAVCPGPTDTPLARANAEVWLGFAREYREAAGIPPHRPEQIANAMVFLNSDAASGISGVNLLVDSGHVMSSISGIWEADKPLMDLLLGRA